MIMSRLSDPTTSSVGRGAADNLEALMAPETWRCVLGSAAISAASETWLAARCILGCAFLSSSPLLVMRRPKTIGKSMSKKADSCGIGEM